MMLHISDLPGCWAPLPPTKAATTGSETIFTQELGTLRGAQE